MQLRPWHSYAMARLRVCESQSMQGVGVCVCVFLSEPAAGQQLKNAGHGSNSVKH